MEAGASRGHFSLPDGVIYLDGNSLGPVARGVDARVADCINSEWATMLIGGWNKAGWMDMPSRLGGRIGRLIGAWPNSVVVGDTLSIRVFQALSAALRLAPEGRPYVLSDTGNFPTDLYMAQGLLRDDPGGRRLRLVEPDAVLESIDEQTAVVMLTHVDYRTGRMHDMVAITRAAHEAGALVIWDLAHSAGAVEVDVQAADVDFACGCTYKYLNGGPGAPAFICVAPRHQDLIDPVLSGWLGHDAPFAFDLDYRPATGVERMRVGTPPVLQMAALDAALDVFEATSMADLRKQSMALTDLFIELVEMRCPDLELASPRDANNRGSQVSWRFSDGYPLMQALIAEGVIGDFRAPDLLRFGFAPLYNSRDDVLGCVETLAMLLETGRWRDPRYAVRARVT